MTKILTIEEVKDILGIGINQTRELVKQPTFPKIRVGKRYLIPEDELDKWIHKNCYS